MPSSASIRISLRNANQKVGIINEFDYFDSEKCSTANEIFPSSELERWPMLMDNDVNGKH